MPFDFSDELCSNGQIAGHHSASGQECIDREEDVAGQGGEDQGTAGGGGEGNSRLEKNNYSFEKHSRYLASNSKVILNILYCFLEKRIISTATNNDDIIKSISF